MISAIKKPRNMLEHITKAVHPDVRHLNIDSIFIISLLDDKIKLFLTNMRSVIRKGDFFNEIK